MKTTKAFTLIEVMVVTIIVVVLATLGAPRFQTTVERSKAAEAQKILLDLFAAQKRYAIYHNGNYTNNVTSLDLEIPDLAFFGNPAVTASDPLRIAAIQRSLPAQDNYYLMINSDGLIQCGSCNAPTVCNKLGFAYLSPGGGPGGGCVVAGPSGPSSPAD